MHLQILLLNFFYFSFAYASSGGSIPKLTGNLGSPKVATTNNSVGSKSPEQTFKVNFARTGSSVAGSPPKIHATEALKTRKDKGAKTKLFVSGEPKSPEHTFSLDAYAPEPPAIHSTDALRLKKDKASNFTKFFSSTADAESPQRTFALVNNNLEDAPAIHSTEALKQQKNSKKLALPQAVATSYVPLTYEAMESTTVMSDMVPFVEYWDAIVMQQVINNNGKAKTQAEYPNGATSQHFSGKDVPVEVVARVMLGVLDAIQKHTNVIEVLTPDHFVVARKGYQWSKQELAGNAKIMINDRVKHVEDPRNRISKHFADGPKNPFFWLWEVLFMSPLQIVQLGDSAASSEQNSVWFLGALLCRMLFNKFPLDGWKLLSDQIGERDFDLLIPQPKYHWIPLNDENGVMQDIYEKLPREQEWIEKIQSAVPKIMASEIGDNVPITFLETDQVDPKLLEVAKKCLQAFPLYRIQMKKLREELERMAN